MCYTQGTFRKQFRNSEITVKTITAEIKSSMAGLENKENPSKWRTKGQKREERENK